MSAAIFQPNRPGWRFWLLWMLATVLGMAAGLVLALPVNLVLVKALSGTWSDPWYLNGQVLTMVSDARGATPVMVGLGMGLGQWLLLRKYLKQMGAWVLATGLASFLVGAFRWSLPADTPDEWIGPITTLGVGILAGVGQWLVLRGRVPHAEWWIVFSIAGCLVSIVIGAAVEYAQFPLNSFLGLLIILVGVIVPFGTAAGGMVWLLRQTPVANQAITA